MGLAVETPTPPDLTNRPLPSGLEETGATSDLRREELEEMLRDGAWNEAFREWAEYTDLTEAEFRTLSEAGLLEGLDFYWDPVAGRLDFEVPDVPASLGGEADLARRAAGELADLGETVTELLEAAYVEWGEADAGAGEWSEQTFGDQSPPEE